METMVAMEVTKLMSSNTFKLKVLKVGTAIHMPEKFKLVNTIQAKPSSNQTTTKLFQKMMNHNSKQLLLNNQFQLLLMLHHKLSNSTQVVFSMTQATVELH